jgi:uncharacterized protein (TIGR02246 family)
MGITRTIATVAASLFLSISLTTACAQNQSNAADPNATAIKQVIADLSNGFNSHDAHAVAMMFAEDCDFTNMRGASHHGRKELEEFFTMLLAGPLKNVHRTDSVKSVRLLTPEIASVDGFWEMTGTKAADGSDNPLRKGLFDYVVTKQNGRWFITIFHESDFVLPQTNSTGR